MLCLQYTVHSSADGIVVKIIIVTVFLSTCESSWKAILWVKRSQTFLTQINIVQKYLFQNRCMNRNRWTVQEINPMLKNGKTFLVNLLCHNFLYTFIFSIAIPCLRGKLYLKFSFTGAEWQHTGRVLTLHVADIQSSGPLRFPPSLPGLLLSTEPGVIPEHSHSARAPKFFIYKSQGNVLKEWSAMLCKQEALAWVPALLHLPNTEPGVAPAHHWVCDHKINQA